jgi:hypothetical protein
MVPKTWSSDMDLVMSNQQPNLRTEEGLKATT